MRHATETDKDAYAAIRLRKRKVFSKRNIRITPYLGECNTPAVEATPERKQDGGAWWEGGKLKTRRAKRDWRFSRGGARVGHRVSNFQAVPRTGSESPEGFGR